MRTNNKSLDVFLLFLLLIVNKDGIVFAKWSWRHNSVLSEHAYTVVVP